MHSIKNDLAGVFKYCQFTLFTDDLKWLAKVQIIDYHIAIQSVSIDL